MKNKKWASMILAICFGVVVLALDIVTKYVVEAHLALGESASFLPGFINFVVVHNNGAAWNSFAGEQVLLIILTFIIIGIFLSYYITTYVRSKKPMSKTLGVAVGLIAGGCFGNLYDRLLFGYVRDFLNFQFMKFPVFNVADMALTFGIIVFVIYLIFFLGKDEKKAKREKSQSIDEGKK